MYFMSPQTQINIMSILNKYIRYKNSYNRISAAYVLYIEYYTVWRHFSTNTNKTKLLTSIGDVTHFTLFTRVKYVKI